MASTSPLPERPQVERDLIDRYHVLQKQLSQIQVQVGDEKKNQERIKQIHEELEKLGGIEAYQTASLNGEVAGGGFDSSSWVLKELGFFFANLSQEQVLSKSKPSKMTNSVPSSIKQLKLLDVGAIVHRYPQDKVLATFQSNKLTQKTVLDVTSIDLNNSNDKRVKQIDFFDFAEQYLSTTPVPSSSPSSSSPCFDCIVLSLVINFVPDPRQRGEMLRKCFDLLLPSPYGLLFIVLPAACVDNARYMDSELLNVILKACQFKILSQSKSGNGKLKFVVCQRQPEKSQKEKMSDHVVNQIPRKKCRFDKGNYNNFSIILSNEKRRASSDDRLEKDHEESSSSKDAKMEEGRKIKLTSNQRKRNRKLAKKAEKQQNIEQEPAVTPKHSNNQRKRSRKEKRETQAQ